MTFLVALFVSYASLFSQPPVPSCPAIPACVAATAWQRGYTAFVFAPQTTRDRMFAAEEAIRSSGGTVAVVHPYVLLGWLDDVEARNAIRTEFGAQIVSSQAIDAARVTFSRSNREERQSLAAIHFFNEVASGAAAARTAAAIHNGKFDIQLTGDVFPPEHDMTPPKATNKFQARVHDAVSVGGVWPNSQMTGRVGVNAFPMHKEPSAISWYHPTDAAWSDWFAQINGAFSFWSSEASARSKSLTFVTAIWYWGDLNTVVQYEPTSYTFANDYLYLNDIMALQTTGYGGQSGGFGASSPVTRQKVHEKIQAYNEHTKTHVFDPATNYAFTIFATPTFNNPSLRFGTNGLRTYAVFGLYTNSLYDGYSTYQRVITHETGHIFWACDEYYDTTNNLGCQSCDPCTGSLGPRPLVNNANCDKVNAPGSCSTSVACMMRLFSDTAAVCSHTAQQIGW